MGRRRIAIIMAGGVGSRLGKEIPKQFFSVCGTQVIAITLEHFEHSAWIDEITIPCAQAFVSELEACCRAGHFTKVKRILPGGSTWLESAIAALDAIEAPDENDTVVFHESVRPLISDAEIADSVQVCERCGSGVSACETYEHIVTTQDGAQSSGYIPRGVTRRLLMPQSYRYGVLRECLRRAGSRVNDYNCIDSLMLGMGYHLHFSLGNPCNFKITLEQDMVLLTQIIKGRNAT